MTSRAIKNYILLVGLAASFGIAQSVNSVEGNIFLVYVDGSRTQLTATGRDSMPSISSDGKEVVFVRSGNGFDDLGIIDLNRQAGAPVTYILPRRLVQKYGVSDISDPQFSPDGSAVYFYTQPGNFGIIMRVNLASKQAIPIAHTAGAITKGKSFDVIQRGKYAGDIVVYKDSEKLTAGRLFLYWLVDPQGMNVAIIANNLADLLTFRSEQGIEDTP